jgi:uncharacterized protein (DUF302 family)
MAKPPIDIASVRSPHSYKVTLTRLRTQIESKELTLFADVDHHAGAMKAGLLMQQATVLIFGNAKAGTPLMVQNPLMALDLPLKVLVWIDDDDKVWVNYNTIDYFAGRFGLSQESLKSISGVSKLVEGALS